MPPRHETIRTDQQYASLIRLTSPLPFVVRILSTLCTGDHDSQIGTSKFVCGIDPGFAGQARNDTELALAGYIQSGYVLAFGISQPSVRDLRARASGRLEVQL